MYMESPAGLPFWSAPSAGCLAGCRSSRRRQSPWSQVLSKDPADPETTWSASKPGKCTPAPARCRPQPHSPGKPAAADASAHRPPQSQSPRQSSRPRKTWPAAARPSQATRQTAPPKCPETQSPPKRCSRYPYSDSPPKRRAWTPRSAAPWTPKTRTPARSKGEWPTRPEEPASGYSRPVQQIDQDQETRA